jgi:lipoate synthase
MRHPTHEIKLFKIPPGRKGHREPASVWALQLLALTGMRRDEIRDYGASLFFQRMPRAIHSAFEHKRVN